MSRQCEQKASSARQALLLQIVAAASTSLLQSGHQVRLAHVCNIACGGFSRRACPVMARRGCGYAEELNSDRVRRHESLAGARRKASGRASLKKAWPAPRE